MVGRPSRPDLVSDLTLFGGIGNSQGDGITILETKFISRQPKYYYDCSTVARLVDRTRFPGVRSRASPGKEFLADQKKVGVAESLDDVLILN